MRIATVSLSGQRQVSREEIFAAAGVTDHSSLLFLDVAEARQPSLKRSRGSPRQRCASSIPTACRSPSPSARPSRCGRCRRQGLGDRRRRHGAFQPDKAKVEPRLATLPFVVGKGAAAKARDFLAVLDKFPADPRCRARRGPGRRTALESQAEERHRRAPARDRMSKQRARRARRASTREKNRC